MRDVRQDSPAYLRRWFFDDHFDLIAWYRHDGTLNGFQLCYNKPDDEKALTWFHDRGLSHHKVDTGEQTPWANRSPMLIESDGRSHMAQLLPSFRNSDNGIPQELRALIELKIVEYGRRSA